MAVVLVIVSAFLHALWNALLRLERDKDRALIAAVAAATVLAAVVAAAQVAITDVAPLPGAAAVGWSLAAGALEWVYFTALARALERGPLGPIYTISRGGAIVVVYPLSIALFGEALTTTSAIGSGVVLAGLALSGARTADHRDLSTGALAWSIACAAAIAGYHLAYKAAIDAGGRAPAVFATALSLATLVNLARSRGVLAYARARAARILLMGAICGGSFLILLEALARGGAGYVLTLRNTSVLFAIVLAFAIRERPGRLQIAGAVLVAAGAIVMALP